MSWPHQPAGARCVSNTEPQALGKALVVKYRVQAPNTPTVDETDERCGAERA